MALVVVDLWPGSNGAQLSVVSGVRCWSSGMLLLCYVRCVCEAAVPILILENLFLCPNILLTSYV